jgi:hypothetical protein
MSTHMSIQINTVIPKIGIVLPNNVIPTTMSSRPELLFPAGKEKRSGGTLCFY